MYILCGLESDWLRRSIWGGIFLCSSHSNPINILKYWLKKNTLRINRNVNDIKIKYIYY
jgi:hypothetical protein